MAIKLHNDINTIKYYINIMTIVPRRVYPGSVSGRDHFIVWLAMVHYSRYSMCNSSINLNENLYDTQLFSTFELETKMG